MKPKATLAIQNRKKFFSLNIKNRNFFKLAKSTNEKDQAKFMNLLNEAIHLYRKINYVDDNKNNVLHCAVKSGSLIHVLYILSAMNAGNKLKVPQSNNIDINIKNASGKSPLDFAEKNKHHKIRDLLVKNGAHTDEHSDSSTEEFEETHKNSLYSEKNKYKT